MFIDATLVAPVAQWAFENCKVFKPNGFNRQYGILQELTPPNEVWEIKRQIIEANDLHNVEQEVDYKDFCGYITKGGAVHQHRDYSLDDKIHVRFNVMISKPDSGGVPVQNGVEIVVQEGEVWRCDSSAVEHWCTPVGGDKPRIILSYGFFL